ncbi:hypothetical protein POPTR_001G452500v4 [Populus trichocarpa]|uniref:Uncharacterized protein n=1 Tax=Populus trichocarpa TaxID=3694 RepID=A0ACC0TPV0_POPTR|nr:hypothetical protein POPTR_001G452500v4 [Populus trichocarpa]
MILVAIVAELMEEYMAFLTRVLEHVFNDAPFPRRIMFLVCHNNDDKDMQPSKFPSAYLILSRFLCTCKYSLLDMLFLAAF